jgi:hypothetical protein
VNQARSTGYAIWFNQRRGIAMTTENAGSSADQHVTGRPEEGQFITDKEPAADTPVHGSGNAGVNEVGGNRVDFDEEPGTSRQ